MVKLILSNFLTYPLYQILNFSFNYCFVISKHSPISCEHFNIILEILKKIIILFKKLSSFHSKFSGIFIKMYSQILIIIIENSFFLVFSDSFSPVNLLLFPPCDPNFYLYLNHLCLYFKFH